MADFDKKDDVINIGNANYNQFMEKLPSRIGGILTIIFVFWLATGIYIVAPDEAGVVKRFGRYTRETSPGPHYHLPYPIEEVLKPKVTVVHRIEIGFRTIDPGPPARYRTIPKEALMITGDENIVAVEMIVQFKVQDAKAVLFNVRNPFDTIRSATESSIREIVGSEKIDEVLTTGKAKMQQDTKELIQETLDIYKTGISVVAVQLQDVNPPKEVMASFKDVASAREDRERLINEALGYQNEIIPLAKGEAAKELNKAQGYRASLIARASGDADRFNKTLQEYRKNKDIIGTKIYIEKMQEILSRPKLVIIDSKASGNVLPLLPLNEYLKGEK